jgi:hypothetical protein
VIDFCRSVLRAAAQAAKDAGRAWAVVPHFYRKATYARAPNGRWRRSWRPFRPDEVLRLKVAIALGVWVASIRLGVSRDVVVTRHPEEGLLANLLRVLEVIRRVRPDARVHVDWTLTGAERGFRYGRTGQDVWAQLFRAIGSPSTERAYHPVSPVDYAFWGKGKDHLTGRHLQKHREIYHCVALKWLEITNHRVLAHVEEICTRHFQGRFCIGVHRRVGNALVARLQKDGKTPSLEWIISRVESILSVAAKAGHADHTVYLATDDAEAVGAFKSAFGDRLIVRENVQRTTARGTEVHYGEWSQVSITDAEDVLIDTVVLSQCNVLVHTSSSVSTVASIMNPALILVRA